MPGDRDGGLRRNRPETSGSSPKIVGHCRFSFFGPSNLHEKVTTEEDARAVLYAEHRMRTRFAFFERVCLPSLAAQTDRDCLILLLASAIMPDLYKERLARLVDGLPHVVAVFAETRDIAEAARAAYQDHVGDDEALHFRVDDDDALAVDYVARLRTLADMSQPGTVLTFPSGLFCYQDPLGFVCFPKSTPFIGLGLARHNAPGDHTSPVTLGHKGLGRRHVSISDPRRIAYIQSYHGLNDSAWGHDRWLARFRKDNPDFRSEARIVAARRQLARWFPFTDYERLEALFSAYGYPPQGSTA